MITFAAWAEHRRPPTVRGVGPLAGGAIAVAATVTLGVLFVGLVALGLRWLLFTPQEMRRVAHMA